MRTRTTASVLLLVGAPLVAPVTLDYMREFLAVDVCLDSGGSYDYSRSACDTEFGHEFVPYVDRHPAAVGVALLGLVAVAIAVAQLARARQRHAA